MSLADGEYDIDISSLLNPSNEYDNVEIKYGFIPDSMDQSKQLTFYQNDQRCMVKGISNNNTPVLFEGARQRQIANSKTSHNSLADDLFLTFDGNDQNIIQLKTLSSIFRLNKSRNVEKLQKEIDELELEYNKQKVKAKSPSIGRKPQNSRPLESTSNNIGTVKKASTVSPIKGQSVSSIKNQSSPIKLELPTTNPTNAKKASNKKASKRPPSATPLSTPMVQPKDNDEVMISESDFEELTKGNDDDKNNEFDEFKDLEDELEQVLEGEPQPKSQQTMKTAANTASNLKSANYYDSSSDSETSPQRFTFQGIKINENDTNTNNSHKRATSFNTNSSNGKPRSLRDYIGGPTSNNNDDSSSEEE